MNNKKTATNRKGMIPNRLNKFSIRKYSVGTASILVGTTLIFGLSGHEAKAAEHTNGELNQSKNEATAPSENKTTEKVDSRQQNNVEQSTTSNQPKVNESDNTSVWIHRNLVTTVFIGFGVPNGSLNYILSKILVVFLSSSLNFSSNK